MELGDTLKKMVDEGKENLSELKKALTWTPLPSKGEILTAATKKSGTLDKDTAVEMATDLLQTTTPIGAFAGIMAGPSGFKRLKTFAGEAKEFTSKFFGKRYEINPPKELLDKFTSGDIDNKIGEILAKRTELNKNYSALVDKVPREAYKKDFSIDYEKLDPGLAKKLREADDAVFNHSTKVGDIIKKEDFPALFEAYPDIGELSFAVTNNPFTKVGGSYTAMNTTGSIQMNKGLMKDKSISNAETFFHELQHAVQHKEYLDAMPDRSFSVDYNRELNSLKRGGSTNPKDISWEAEAYDSGLRDAYPDLRQMPIETAKKIAPKVENAIYTKFPGQALMDTKYVQRNIRNKAELDHMIQSGFLLPKAGGKAKKYFTAVDDVNPVVPEGNTMIRIARDKVLPDEAVRVEDVEVYDFVTNSWTSMLK